MPQVYRLTDSVPLLSPAWLFWEFGLDVFPSGTDHSKRHSPFVWGPAPAGLSVLFSSNGFTCVRKEPHGRPSAGENELCSAQHQRFWFGINWDLLCDWGNHRTPGFGELRRPPQPKWILIERMGRPTLGAAKGSPLLHCHAHRADAGLWWASGSPKERDLSFPSL